MIELIDIESDVLSEFQSCVGQPVEIAGKSIEELMDAYEKLFIGAYSLSQQSLKVGAKPGYQSALEWLRTTDFYTAPASTQYHESVAGGLVTHSLKVYNKVVDLMKADTFKESVNIAEAALVALVHDWCKIDYYTVFYRNVKDDNTGKWTQQPGFKVNQKGIPLGHGATSLYLASRVMRLTPEQALAIRWHQSHWNVCKVEENELQKANESFPMVHLIQFADQLAITNF